MSRTCLADLIRAMADQRADAVALVFEGVETTYRALDDNSNRAANGFAAFGVEPGDRIAYLGKNRDVYFEAWIAAAKCGAVMVPVNWRLSAAEVKQILDDCTPVVTLADPEFLPLLPSGIANLLLTEAATGTASAPLYRTWRDGQANGDPRADRGYDAPVLMLYTSGTTGRPKGVLISNENLFHIRASHGSAALPEWYRWTAEDVALVAMPVFHISGAGWGLWALQHGARAIVVREFDPHRVLGLLSTHRITKVMIVPTALKIVCEHPNARDTDFSFLKVIYYGGSAIPLDLLRQAIDIFGCGFAQMYGMTETAGTIAGLPPLDHDPAGNERMKSVGLPLPGVEIAILDAEGNELRHDEVGEIAIRSKVVTQGYHNLPEETRTMISPGGWFRTGDAGRIDADGYIYLADRIKDMIISGGENIYPAEVENALYGHPDVQDVAVISIADPKWGEAVKAVIVPRAGATPDPRDLDAWARARIAAYKVPKHYEFRDSLPRNSSGKILRRLLRAEIEAAPDSISLSRV